MTGKRWLLCALLVAILPPAATYAVTGVCANCHVMHASIQSTVTPNPEGPQNYLMKDTCLGCHTQTGGGSGAPYVYGATTDLAGGDFDYASGASTTNGHNPVGIGTADIVTPPGWKVSTDFDDNGQVGTVADGVAWPTQLTCDGVWGCHGLHTATGIKGAHHNNPAAGVSAAGTSIGNSYRFLYRIKGYEDADYEAETTTNHNVYYGAVRVADTPTDTQTIDYLCAECHGLFHSGAGTEGVANTSFASPWIRHPVDIAMPAPASGDYSGYTTYRADAPVASTALTTAQHTTASTSVAGSTNRIVMCLSCHRAHATPYYASMRWDYRGTAGTWVNGCSYCHTAKN